MQGWDRAIGSMLGLFLRGQAEKQQEESLRQVLENYQREKENTMMQAGMMQGPPRPAMPAAPAPSSYGPGVGGFLSGVGSDLMRGVTGSSPELASLKSRVEMGQQDLTRSQTMADWLQQQQVGMQGKQQMATWEAQQPLGVAAKEQIGLQEQLRAQAEAERFRQEKSLKGIPQATEPSFQEQTFGKMTPAQQQEFIQRQATGLGTGSFTQQLFGAMSPEQKTGYVNRLTGQAGNVGGMSPPQQQAYFKLADDYARDSRDFNTTKTYYQRMQSVATDPSAAGDLSIIFSYMKILDPTSTVREGEQASAAQATGVPDRILNLYNKVATGEKLNPAQRADFMNKSSKIFASQAEQQDRINKQYEQKANTFQLPPDLIVQPTHPTASTSAPGQVFHPPAAGGQAEPWSPGSDIAKGLTGSPSYMIDEGPMKGTIIDIKATYEQMKAKGMISGKERVRVEMK